MEMGLAAPIHRAMIRRVKGVIAAGDPRSTVAAEMFLPIVEKHSPGDVYVGEPCASCGDEWPCKTLLDTLLSIH